MRMMESFWPLLTSSFVIWAPEHIRAFGKKGAVIYDLKYVLEPGVADIRL